MTTNCSVTCMPGNMELLRKRAQMHTTFAVTLIAAGTLATWGPCHMGPLPSMNPRHSRHAWTIAVVLTTYSDVLHQGNPATHRPTLYTGSHPNHVLPSAQVRVNILVSSHVTILFTVDRHCSRRARDLWWSGIPPSVRGRVWKLAFGNDLNLTKGSC